MRVTVGVSRGGVGKKTEHPEVVWGLEKQEANFSKRGPVSEVSDTRPLSSSSLLYFNSGAAKESEVAARSDVIIPQGTSLHF